MNELPRTTVSAREGAGHGDSSSPDDSRPCHPYPGLRPFQPEESAIFFGRGEQVGEMLTRLEDHQFLAVVGASGCGKSSLVLAGLLPALEQGFLAAASDQWRFVKMRPGDAPLRNLASELVRELGSQSSTDDLNRDCEQPDPQRVAMTRAALRSGPRGLVQVVDDARLPLNTNVLILVDQFEELFRFRHRNRSLDGQSQELSTAVERDEAAAFVSLLLATAAQHNRPIYVVITMRSDFLGDCDAFHGLPEAINDSQYLTPRLTREQARDVIVEPARLFGGDVAPALVNRILNEIGNDPDQLPMMQHALMRAWRHAEKKRGQPVTIQLADYEHLGGLKKALSNHADYVLEHLESDADRRVAESLFRALCDRSAGQRLTRRLATVAEIAAIAGAEVDDVIRVADAFRGSGRNLLTPPIEKPLSAESTLDISHESLIRQWDTLQNWLALEEQSARTFRRLAETARLWTAGQAGLYRPPELDLARQWKDDEKPTAAWGERYVPGAFTEVEHFLEVSRQTETERQNVQERQRQAEVQAKERDLANARDLAEAQKAKARDLRRMLGVVGSVAAIAVLLFIWASVAQRMASRAEAAAHAAERDAIEAREVAERQQKSAEQERDRAETEKRRAEEAEKLATAERQRAERHLKRSEWLLYASQIASAQREWETGSADLAWRHLNSTRWDFRGWEHDYLYTLFHQNQTTLQGHTRWVSSVAFSPDGARIVSGSRDNTLKVWDASSGQEMLTLKGHNGFVNSVAFSPDGTQIVSGSRDNTLKVWDASSGQEMLTLKGHDDFVISVAFSPDGARIVSGSGDGTLKVWDASSGQETLTLQGHTKSVMGVAFSSDGARIVSGSDDNTLKVWDASSGQETLTLEGHTGTVSSVAFSPDGTKIVSGSWDNTLKSWDASNGQETLSFQGHTASVRSVAFSPDGAWIVSGSDDNTLKVWNASSGQKTLTLKGHTNSVYSVAFSPDGAWIVSGSDDNTLKVWNASSAQETLTRQGRTGTVRSVAFSPDSARIVSGSDDNTLKVWDAPSGQETLTFQGHTGTVRSVAFSPDGARIVSGSDDNTLKVWDASSGQETLTLQGHTDFVSSVTFSPDGTRIVSGSGDNTVKVWDASSGQETLTLQGHTRWVSGVAFSPDGTRIVSGSGDDTLKVWDASSGQETLTLQGHFGWVSSVAFSSDGARIASGSGDNTVKIWDASSGQETLTLQGHNDSVSSVAFSPDGARIVSGSDDNTLKVWDASSGQETLMLQGHNDSVSSLAFSPDGARIVSGSWDRTVKVWDASSGPEIGAASDK